MYLTFCAIFLSHEGSIIYIPINIVFLLYLIFIIYIIKAVKKLFICNEPLIPKINIIPVYVTFEPIILLIYNM